MRRGLERRGRLPMSRSIWGIAKTLTEREPGQDTHYRRHRNQVLPLGHRCA